MHCFVSPNPKKHDINQRRAGNFLPFLHQKSLKQLSVIKIVGDYLSVDRLIDKSTNRCSSSKDQ